MKLIITRKVKSCLLWHNWVIAYDNGYSVYSKCSCVECDARKVEQPGYGYQPINYKWLYGDTNENI